MDSYIKHGQSFKSLVSVWSNSCEPKAQASDLALRDVKQKEYL